MPEFVADDRPGKTYTEYGIEFPNGDRQWDSHGPLTFNLSWLATDEGRVQAQEQYDDAVASLNLVPTPNTLLKFVKRTRAHAYSAVEVID